MLPSSAGATTVTFNYTGAPESWTVPYGVTSATFNLYGAQGRGFGPGSSAQGGRGGWARATIPVTANSVVTFRVGGRGVANGGGYNGGGSGGYGGGGATDIRIGGDALADRVLVAGGGGGGGFSCLNNNVTVIAVGGDGGGVN
ncbi:MAG TPA: glycine-rich protein, partial [Solirubrobacterales bacterium]|nr:glycine-rich protein [Solirubrobacterales bacterium]